MNDASERVASLPYSSCYHLPVKVRVPHNLCPKRIKQRPFDVSLSAYYLIMGINWQPLHLGDERVFLEPLRADHFNELFAVASDPEIWVQHPNPDRYREDVFQIFFEGAKASAGAFIIRAMDNGRALGSTRFYEYDEAANEVKVGYTFFSRACWGKGWNPAVKRLMLRYAFAHVSRVVFHVGTQNIRSQRAMEQIGARQVGELAVAYHGEPVRQNVVYEILADDFHSHTP